MRTLNCEEVELLNGDKSGTSARNYEGEQGLFNVQTDPSCEGVPP